MDSSQLTVPCGLLGVSAEQPVYISVKVITFEECLRW